MRPQSSQIKYLFITVTISLFIISCDGQNYETWTIVNRMDTPIVLDGTFGGAVKANDINEYSDYFPKEPDGITYRLRAFEFIPGEGNEFGWNLDGKYVRGRRGQFLFCNSFTWQELNAMKRIIVIDQNMINGRKIGEPRPDYCP